MRCSPALRSFGRRLHAISGSMSKSAMPSRPLRRFGRPGDSSSVEAEATVLDAIPRCHAVRADIGPAAAAEVQDRPRPFPGHQWPIGTYYYLIILASPRGFEPLLPP